MTENESCFSLIESKIYLEPSLLSKFGYVMHGLSILACLVSALISIVLKMSPLLGLHAVLILEWSVGLVSR